MHICYYITSHGYGHAVRSVSVINALPSDISVTVRTTVPREFFQRELKRQFTYAPAEFDCGCIQTDSMSIDKKKTLEVYAELALHNARCLDAEAAWCTDQSIDMIISDIVPFAFSVAQKTSLPSIGISNFTWLDIYRPYCDEFPDHAYLIDTIEEQYQLATLMCKLSPACPMDYFPHAVSVGVVGAIGTPSSAWLHSHVKIAPTQKIGLIYPGSFGMNIPSWKNLERFSGWSFLGTYELPDAPDNYHYVDPAAMSYHNLFASADVVISKIGYGICSGCMLHGVPLIYLPRNDFAEFPFLESAMQAWGTNYCLTHEQYHSLDWEAVLYKIGTNPRPKPVGNHGVAQCVSHILQLASTHAA